jgi:TrmH family RNA methyltransferase
MKNMGLSSLILVAPEEDPLSLEARMMATSAKDVLEKARICQTLGEALLGFRWIAATSARRGKNRGPFISPREISPEIIDHAWSIPVAIIFGPEDHGLTNEELAPCHALISVPTHRRLSSLNLAQAVILVGYELHLASLSEGGAGNILVARKGKLRGSGVDLTAPAPPAEFQKVEKMYAQMEELLLRIGFLDPKNPKRIMHTLRRVFGRAKLSDRDVAILRGVFRQLEWYATHYNDSKKSGLP